MKLDLQYLDHPSGGERLVILPETQYRLLALAAADALKAMGSSNRWPRACRRQYRKHLRRSKSGSRDTAMAWPEWPLSRKTCRRNPEHGVPDRVHREDRLDENVEGDCRRALRAGRSGYPARP